MLFPKNATFFFLVSVVALLPLAQFKCEIFHIPLYLPEIATLLALISTFFSSKKRAVRLDTVMWCGGLLFLFGAVISFLTNPQSLSGLGMLKSWFLFPALFGMLLWHELFDEERRAIVVGVWLAVIGAVLVRSLFLFSIGDVTYDYRLRGDYPSPNFLAFFIAPFPLLLGYVLLSLKRNRSLFVWTVSLLALGLFFFVSFLTHSYGAWIAVALAASVFMALTSEGKLYQKGILSLFVVVAFGLFFFDSGSAKWQSLIHQDSRSSLSSRVMIWRAAMQITSDNPFLGIGLGRFQEVYLEYQNHYPPYLEWAVPEPHNIFLAVYLSTGLIGFFGFFLLVARVFVLTLSQKKYASSALSFSLLLLFLVYGLTDTPYFKNDLATLFFLSIVFVSQRQSPPGEL